MNTSIVTNVTFSIIERNITTIFYLLYIEFALSGRLTAASTSVNPEFFTKSLMGNVPFGNWEYLADSYGMVMIFEFSLFTFSMPWGMFFAKVDQ